MGNSAAGSLWRKWDLHFHTPSSFDVTASVTNEDIIAGLLARQISAVAITDHHVMDVERIQRLQELAGDRIVIFPGIELRSELGGSESVHFVGIFPPLGSGIDLASTWTSLQGRLKITPREVIEKGNAAVYVDLRDGASVIHDLGGLVSVHAGGKSNSIENIRNTKEYKKQIKMDLVGDCIDIFEAGDPQDITEYRTQVFPVIGMELPVIVASDTHHRPTDPSRAPCWIKADTTFVGLKRILKEPRGRVFVGAVPPSVTRVAEDPTKFAVSVRIAKKPDSDLSEHWFDDDIPINPGLVAIIGNKGGGKSALSDTLGLLGNTVHAADFSFLTGTKFRQARENKAEHFVATIRWASGYEQTRCLADDVDFTQPETIKYIPQSYLETVCTQLAVGGESGFDCELKTVIFSHVADQDRLGCSSLDALLGFKTEQAEESIRMLRDDLHRIHESMAAAETKLQPPYRSQLQNALIQKESELAAHDSAAPAPVAEPARDSAEDARNATMAASLAEAQASLSAVEAGIADMIARRKAATLRKALAEKLVEKLRALEGVYGRFVKDFAEFTSLGLDVAEVATITVQPARVQVIYSESARIVEDCNRQLDEGREGSLAAQRTSLIQKIAELQKELDLPNQLYQAYVGAQKAWAQRRQEILGRADLPGTVEGLREEIRQLDEVVPGQLREIRAQQSLAVQMIYEHLAGLADTYRALYAPVDRFVMDHPLAHGGLDLSFSVSISPSDFEGKFFEFISQARKGSFCGTEEGTRRLRQLLDRATFGSLANVSAFLAEVDNALRFDLRGSTPEPVSVDSVLKKGQNSVAFYNFLFGLEYLRPRYVLKWAGKDLGQLSAGERGTLLLIFYLLVDRGTIPLVIDQPEENLDNETVFRVLVPCIKEVRERRQIILCTHNPNLAVVCDADQIIYTEIDKAAGCRVSYTSGAIENPVINDHVVDVLEGTRPAFDNRDAKYKIVGH
jgi:hypothetical protein